MEQATKAFGYIDILILTAGILQFGYFKDIPSELDRRVMEVNYFGQRTLIQAVLPGELHAAAMPWSHIPTRFNAVSSMYQAAGVAGWLFIV